MSDKLSPEATVRLLRAKGAELEHRFLIEQESLDEPMTTLGTNMLVTGLMADIALVAQLLADHIEGALVPIGDPLFNEDGTPWERPRIVPPEVW